MTSEVERQRSYYRSTAPQYDDAHAELEHVHALHLLGAYVELNDVRSILDIGAGTGRAMLWLRERFPGLVIKGVEPVDELREIGHSKGLSREDLLPGDGANLSFADNSFDLVCEFAVLHHVRRPGQVVAEMSRVARRMVAISDCNFMGQGPKGVRAVKSLLYLLGLWRAADWVKTRGKGYTISEGDGLAYSYSIFQDVGRLRHSWRNIRLITTGGDADGPFGLMRSAAHLLVVASGKKVPVLPD